MDDLISRADALRELNGVCSNWEDDAKVQEIVMAIPSTKPTGELISKTYAEEQINTLASAEIAETEPIVIRSKTLMPTKDFKEWAKRIKEVNPNAVVIPCDAEVASAEAVQGWIPCSERLPSAEDCPMDCMVTRYSEQIGAYVDMAVCERDGTWTHEDWDAIVLGDVESGRKTGLMNTHKHPILAWMPLPKPYKGGDSE